MALLDPATPLAVGGIVDETIANLTFTYDPVQDAWSPGTSTAKLLRT